MELLEKKKCKGPCGKVHPIEKFRIRVDYRRDGQRKEYRNGLCHTCRRVHENKKNTARRKKERQERENPVACPEMNYFLYGRA